MNASKQAKKALKNAITRAEGKTTPAKKAETLRRGMDTAISWLDGSHPKL